MRVERILFVSHLVAAVAASACGNINAVPDGGGDTGRVACRGLAETACRARTDCAVGACSLCGGTPTFAGCYDPATEGPPVCAGVACPPLCAGLDEASCKARSDCRVDACPDCNGGSGFIRCANPGDPQPGCPAILCPEPCAQLTTKDTCEARPDCHSVFVDGRDCGCAALGCCTRFSRCADGDKAVCAPPPALTCTTARPYCEGPYVVSYAGGCYEGCALATDCAAVTTN